MIIGTDEQGRSIYNARKGVADNTLLIAVGILQKLIPTVKSADLTGGILNYLSDYLTKDPVLKHLDPKTILPRYNELYPLDVRYKEYFVGDKANFDIVLTTKEQKDAYKYAKELTDLLNKNPLLKDMPYMYSYFVPIPLVVFNGSTFDVDIKAIPLL